ncbi:DUF7144 family membrane protein [Agromyces badenianii]|uniref:DUF7144 family membrane protein n=1 Tax=Agromyces badenianii TaxID=2080742 RepID=UPI000D592FDE|nr:hypothetical protein [Agromyces badenianii]PWC05187.1 hypothetical protein DCE94_02470 [Agromyces badenianii]
MTGARRPGGVTLVAVLAWISGLLDIVGGTILLFQTSAAATVEQFGGASQLIASAIVTILIGAVVIAVAGGLLRGSAGARVVVTIFQVLSIASSIFLAIAYPAGAIGEYFSMLISVIVLALLWSGRANAFFRE